MVGRFALAAAAVATAIAACSVYTAESPLTPIKVRYDNVVYDVR